MSTVEKTLETLERLVSAIESGDERAEMAAVLADLTGYLACGMTADWRAVSARFNRIYWGE